MAEIGTSKSDPEFLKLPLDDQGFAIAFATQESKEALEFFKKYGIVVFKDVLTKEEQNATIEALYEYLKDTRATFDRNDYSTWENKFWPSDMKFGFFSDFPIFHLKEGWDNRQNANVHKAFSTVWEREDLWVSFDRFGFMRPTVNLKINGKKCNRSAWRTTETFLHLDQNPLLDPEFCRVQGILNLKDNKTDDGGFQAVPGSHKHFRAWGLKNKSSIPPTSHLVSIPSDDIQQKHIQKIPLRAGSLLIWDSRVSHGNFPNHSSSPRIVQYITMWPNKEDNEEHVKVRTSSFKSGERVNSMGIVGHGYNRPRWVRKNFVPPLRPAYTPPELTDLGKKLCGLKKWKETEPAASKKDKTDTTANKKRKIKETECVEETISLEEPPKKRSKLKAEK